jgi:hypothetical protein
VARCSDALARDDAPSLQRAIRYAAALGRVGRWQDAGVVFRRAFRRGACERVPAERAALVRVFSRELYAPALAVECLAHAPADFDAAIALALFELDVLRRVSAGLLSRHRGQDAAPPRSSQQWDARDGEHARSGSPRAEQSTAPPRSSQCWDARDRGCGGDHARSGRSGAEGLVRGMCEWLAGDDERAYELLDDAERDDGDLTAQYLLLCCAQSIGAAELPSIAAFAARAARAVIARAEHTPAPDEALFYALATLARLEGTPPAPPPLMAADGWVALYAGARASARAGEPCPELAPAAGPWREQLRRIVAFRVAQHAAGRSKLTAATASAAALAGLLSAFDEQAVTAR